MQTHRHSDTLPYMPPSRAVPVAAVRGGGGRAAVHAGAEDHAPGRLRGRRVLWVGREDRGVLAAHGPARSHLAHGAVGARRGCRCVWCVWGVCMRVASMLYLCASRHVRFPRRDANGVVFVCFSTAPVRTTSRLRNCRTMVSSRGSSLYCVLQRCCTYRAPLRNTKPDPPTFFSSARFAVTL